MTENASEHFHAENVMDLDSLRKDCARKQKKGLPFILTSVLIWTGILCVHLTGLPIVTKNLLTFCCAAPLVPVAFLVSKLIGVDFQGKDNPLTKLGLLFTINQIVYLLIAMWVYNAVPDKLLMVFAMIFGAHLMPYSWLYLSKSYFAFSIAVPILSLIVGLMFPPFVLAAVMIGVEILFNILLCLEVRSLNHDSAK